ncbi:M23 family metallopeptidase [Rhodococcus aerolatus]
MVKPTIVAAPTDAGVATDTETAADEAGPAARGLHRTAVTRGRAAAAVVAAGAIVATVQAVGSDSPAGAATQEVSLAAGSSAVAVPAALAAPQVLTVAKQADPTALTALAKGQRMGDERAAREAAARAPLFVDPAQGTLTSGFGARWGAQHLGIDIANAIGTPIGAVAAGTVIEAGPASGFGLWVRVLHDDGTITVYGHVNEIIAPTGTRVTAGQEIATIGNRGQSTGPHLHFEVWANGKDKIDPLPWLAQRGINLGPMMG